MSSIRVARERDYWKKLDGKWRLRDPIVLSDGVTPPLNISSGTSILGGLNGAGKSRVLRSIHANLGQSAVLLRTSEAVEQTLLALRSIEELSQLAEETGSVLLSGDRRSDAERIVGREYQDLDWYSLELEELQEGIDPVFVDDDGAIFVPHFRATYGNVSYSSLEMGLGEFSTHLLLWILEQRRDVKGLTVILDEPDAFLPPSAALRMIARLQGMAIERDWRLIIASHSEALISEAARRGNFIRLYPSGGEIKSITIGSAVEEPEVLVDLLPPPSPRVVAFCEDELAALFFEELIGRGTTRSASFFDTVWKDGHGYIRSLDGALPAPHDRQRIKFVLVLDGDQRAGGPLSGGWPCVFLPGESDPADLLFSLRSSPSEISEAFKRSVDDVRRILVSLEGFEAHDWVAGLCERAGNPEESKRQLIRKWIELNGSAAQDFSAAIMKLPI
jgi:predicted ATPase